MERNHHSIVRVGKTVEDAKAVIERSKRSIAERSGEIKKRITELQEGKNRIVSERMRLLKARQQENQEKVRKTIEKRKSIKWVIEKMKY